MIDDVVVHTRIDRHALGVFSRATWKQLMTVTGLPCCASPIRGDEIASSRDDAIDSQHRWCFRRIVAATFRCTSHENAMID
jgi:hypothetical protein